MQKTAIDFSKYSSIKIGGVLEVAVLEDCAQAYQDHYIIGSCNNVLMGLQPPLLVKISKNMTLSK